MAERRDALKIIGTIGATCLFPFDADELYGQQAPHTHGEAGPVAPMPATPKTLTPAEFEIVSRVADLIIPETDTPGAVQAGVPGYIDYVAGKNPTVRQTLATGLAWLAKSNFLKRSPARQESLLRALCNSAETKHLKGDRERFWSTIKSLTADGYYTSLPGMRDELGYKGNAILEQFPDCSLVPEH